MAPGDPVEMTDAGRRALRKAGVKEESHVTTGTYRGETGNPDFIIVQLDGEPLPQWAFKTYWRKRKV